MSKIWSMMDVGKQSLANSQTGLQTVSHNIANKSTEGYSRQRVDFVTNEPIGLGKLRIGMGAKPGVVGRVNNPYLEKQLEREGAELGYAKSKAELMGKVEQVYNEQVNRGLNKYIGDFFNSCRELSNNPESLATRTAVKETAMSMIKDFGRVNRQLDEIQSNADFQITSQVTEINKLTTEIAKLNERIQNVEVTGGRANDERDRRDLLIKKLGEKINIQVAEIKNGMVNINAGASAILVSGYSQRDLKAAATEAEGGKAEGRVDVFYLPTDHTTPVKITEQIKGGDIGALIEVRDKTVTGLRHDMDELAYTLGNEMNDIHMSGYDRYSEKGGMFFKGVERLEDASMRLALHENIEQDPGRIAAAAIPNAPGDNRVANLMSQLQYKHCMRGTSVDNFYNTMVGEIGVRTKQANDYSNSQSEIVAQLTNLRDSVSGVSLDEEATKMIEFQKTFDASARLIRTADEMMDTVLNLKRL